MVGFQMVWTIFIVIAIALTILKLTIKNESKMAAILFLRMLYGQDHNYSYSKSRPFKYRPSKSPDFEWFQILYGRFLDPQSPTVLKHKE